MKRFGAALLLLMGLLFGCTLLTGLDREYVLDTGGSSGGSGWSQLFGSVEDQMGVSVAIDSGGNTLLAGHFTGSIQFGGERLVSAGGYDIFVAKLDPNGNYVWSQPFGGAADERCYGVEVDSADNVVLTGDFEGEINFGPKLLPHAGGHDVFVAKLDPTTGTPVWSTRAGDGASQYGYGIAVNRADDSIVVTGPLKAP